MSELAPDLANVWTVLALAPGLLLGIGGYVIARDTWRREGRWGINFQALKEGHCPGCGRPLPPVKLPASVREAVWGGWTCSRCGTAIDQWGRRILRRHPPHGLNPPHGEKPTSPLPRP